MLNNENSKNDMIYKIMSNKITPEELKVAIDRGEYQIKNLSYQEISNISSAFNFIKLGHSLTLAILSKSLDIVKLILEYGGKPLNQEDVKEKHYFKADTKTIAFTHTLHSAIQTLIPHPDYAPTDEEKNNYTKENAKNICKIVQLLFKSGAEVVNELEYSTLHYAVETRCHELVELVITRGAEYVPGKRRSVNCTASQDTKELALKTGCDNIIKLVTEEYQKVRYEKASSKLEVEKGLENQSNNCVEKT